MTIEELSKDSEFLKKIENAKGADEIIALFKDKGIDVTKEDLEKIAAMPESGELSEADMENVAGGILLGPSLLPISYIVARAIIKAYKR